MNLKKRLEGFLHLFENDCKECFRPGASCANCRSSEAKRLLEDLRKTIDAPKKIDNSIGARFARVIHQMREASKPLLSSEINLPDCSKTLKEYTINTMLARGIITREKDGKFYRYYPVVKQSKKDETNG